MTTVRHLILLYDELLNYYTMFIYLLIGQTRQKYKFICMDHEISQLLKCNNSEWSTDKFVTLTVILAMAYVLNGTTKNCFEFSDLNCP